MAVSTSTYTTGGTYQWTCPSSVTQITVRLWGGGGAGGGANYFDGTNFATSRGGGGAGGQFAESILSVVPGTTYQLVVAASRAGTTGTSGLAGYDSTFATDLVVAKGGAGGTCVLAGDGAGGLGSTVGGVGDIVYAGGNGANGSVTSAGSGPGGGGAGTTGAGGNATATVAGAGKTLYGGNGGARRTSSGNGNAGVQAGGGGGGGFAATYTNRAGGTGAAGRAEISYTIPKTESGSDEFNALDTSKWTVVNSASVQSGKLTVNSVASSASDSFISSKWPYDLSDSFNKIEVVSNTGTSVSTFSFWIILEDSPNLSGSNGLYLNIEGSTISAYEAISGTFTPLYSTTYDSSVHKWLRVRETSGTTFWEYSTNGTDWTTLYNKSTAITVTSLYPAFSSNNDAASSEVYGVTVDNLNITPAGSADLTVNETCTLADSITSAVEFSQTLNETCTLADSYSNNTVYSFYHVGYSKGSYTVNYPAGSMAGDFAVIIAAGDMDDIIPPSGWTTLKLDSTTTSMRIGLFYRFVPETQTAAIVGGTSDDIDSLMSVFRGVTAYEAFASAYSTTTGMPDPPSLSGFGQGKASIVCGAVSDTGGAVVPPTGYTLSGYQDAQNAQTIMTAYKAVTDATENPTAFSNTGSDDWFAFTIRVAATTQATSADQTVSDLVFVAESRSGSGQGETLEASSISDAISCAAAASLSDFSSQLDSLVAFATKVPLELVSTSDLVALTSYSNGFTETIGLSDSVVSIASFTQTVSDSILTSENLVAFVAISPGESFSVNDTVTPSLAAGLVESSAATTTLVASSANTISEVSSSSDSLISGLAGSKIEVVTEADSIQIAAVRIASEVAFLLEGLSSVTSLITSFSEVVFTSDGVESSQTASHTVSELVSTGDSVLTTAMTSILFNTVGIADSVESSFSQSFTVSETVSVTEFVLKSTSVSTIDSVTSNDYHSGSVNKSFLDYGGFVEEIRTSLGGFVFDITNGVDRSIESVGLSVYEVTSAIEFASKDIEWWIEEIGFANDLQVESLSPYVFDEFIHLSDVLTLPKFAICVRTISSKDYISLSTISSDVIKVLSSSKDLISVIITAGTCQY